MIKFYKFTCVLLYSTLFIVINLISSTANSIEYPISKPLNVQGMEITVVYLQPITMDPVGTIREASKSDVHLEVDIRARTNNVLGFADDAWIPYLQIHYQLQKYGTVKYIEGNMVAMLASDGPHYGDNIKLNGPGKYKINLLICPPKQQIGLNIFGRHIDKETGVGQWFKPITFSGEFIFAGTGKKGAY